MRFVRSVLAAWLVFVIPLSLSSPAIQNSDLARTRKIAEAQHDIVIILIKKKEFAKAAEEANKIFQMNWPEDQEQVLKDELLRFSDLLRHNGEVTIALQLINANLALFKTPKIRADVLKDKAFLLECLGQHDEALQTYREVTRLLQAPNSSPNKKTETPDKSTLPSDRNSFSPGKFSSTPDKVLHLP
jgi:tetratricopeptide (TPR) repeat protein